jgi:hypothetical protein
MIFICVISGELTCDSELVRPISRFHITNEEQKLFIQDDQRVIQSILKYLLVVAIQCNLIGLINTDYQCDHTRGRAGHVVL